MTKSNKEGKKYCPDCKQEITDDMPSNNFGWCEDCYNQWRE